MILNKLSKIKQDAHMQSERAQKRENAIKSLQSILNQIDFSVEEVPINLSSIYALLTVSDNSFIDDSILCSTTCLCRQAGRDNANGIEEVYRRIIEIYK